MCLFVSVALGFLILGQTVSFLTRVGTTQLLGSVMVIVVVRELGPLLTAFLVLARAGSGRIDAAKLAETGSLLAQRLALLYEGNAPDFFDPVSFRQFIATLRELGLVQEDERQRLTFGAALTASARRAEWVLDGETLAAIQQLTGLDPVEGMRDPD
mgnify:CR=1 FL=1